MTLFSTYTIHEADRFNPENFPLVTDELNVLNDDIAHLPVHFRSEIILSYLRDHCIKNDWISDNPALTAMVTSARLRTSHIESLFESARGHKQFLFDFEAYLTDQIEFAGFLKDSRQRVNDVTL